MLLGDSFETSTELHCQFFRWGKRTALYACVWMVLLFSFLVSWLCEGPAGQGLAACPVPLPQPGAGSRGHRDSPSAGASGISLGMGTGHCLVGQAGMTRLAGPLAALEQNCESCDDGKKKKKIGHDDVDCSA